MSTIYSVCIFICEYPKFLESSNEVKPNLTDVFDFPLPTARVLLGDETVTSLVNQGVCIIKSIFTIFSQKFERHQTSFDKAKPWVKGDMYSIFI